MNNISYIILACYVDKGMKSHGSKGLMSFHDKKILDYQIEAIHKSQNKKHSYEIIIISDFDTTKINKLYDEKAKIYSLDEHNPIHKATLVSEYDTLLFIDYGCIFESSIIKNIQQKNSSVFCIDSYNKSNKLDVGCITEGKNKLQHMFFDLPENKFTNIFTIIKKDKNTILNDSLYHNKNLLYFEIINKLKNNGSIIDINLIPNNKFIFFNTMKQKYAISKFTKNIK